MKDIEKEKPKDKIPVTIITGFLGAGKTTFLNHILKKYPNTRFAIIENEFGVLGVDKDILQNEKIPVYELVNGCICCSLSADFYQSLQLIVDSHSNIDHLLIESTGIADPAQIVDLFLSNEQIQSSFLINSVVCVADVTTIQRLLENEPEAVKQVALSDVIVLNKMDLLCRNQATDQKNIVQLINPMAQIVETRHCHTNGTPLLDTGAYSFSHIERTTLSFETLKISIHQMARKNLFSNIDEQKFRHNITAESFILADCFDPDLFNIWISSFIYFNQTSLYRVKGILYFPDKNKKVIVQAVNGSCIFEEGSSWKSDEEKFSKIVFIGKLINRLEIQAHLQKFFVDYQSIETSHN